MGWLTDLTNWLAAQIHAVWDALVLLAQDLALFLMEAVMDLSATAIEAIPVPDFIAQVSIGQFLAAAGPEVQWVLVKFRIAEGLGFIAAGYAFRLLRKLLTLGQW